MSLGERSDRHRPVRAFSVRSETALTELEKRHEVQLRVFTGRVRGLDLDKLTLILRDVAGKEGDVQLALEDERLLETAREAHYQELEVNVAARGDNNRLWSATEIEFVGTNAERSRNPATRNGAIQ